MKQGGWIILYDRKTGGYLMGLRASDNKWDFFGGNIEEGEKPKMGALREFREETGINLSKDGLLKLRKIVTKKRKVYVYFCVLKLDALEKCKRKINLSKEHTKFGFFRLHEIPENITNVTKLILKECS